MVAQFVGRPLFTLAESRFYLALVISASVLAALFLSESLSISLDETAKRLLGTQNTSTMQRKFLVILVLSLFSVAWVSPYYLEYNEGLATNNKLSFSNNGWNEIREWVDLHTSEQDVFLTTASARLWAWFLNKAVVGLTVFDEGVALSPANITYNHLAALFQTYNISYLIVDRTFQSYEAYYPLLWQVMGAINNGLFVLFNSTYGSYNLTNVMTSSSTVTTLGVYLFHVQYLSAS
jgi:hypothetical protein